MWNNYDAVRPSRYSDHFGHRAWPFYSKSVEGAVIEDLFWRKVQTDTDFAVAVARTIWPQSERMKGELLLNSGLSMSLLPESRGAYTFGAWGGLYTLRGDGSDARRIDMGEQRPDLGGYYLGQLVAKHTGWLPQNVVPNLLQRMGKRLSVADRFRFSVKANHRQVPLGKRLTADEVLAILEVVCPAARNLFFRNVHWYKRECGDINYGIIYLRDSNGKLYKFPLSAWESDTIANVRPVYDLLNIATPYPLYDLDKIVRSDWAKTVLICDSEETVDYIGREHAWTHHWGPVTTYAAIDGTDWSKLKDMTPIIFPEATERGCHEAFRLYAALVKHGFTPRFLARTRGNLPWVQEFAQDIGRRAFNERVWSLTEFAAHSKREFGVQPPAGVLPKGVALSALARSAVPSEVLMEGLLHTREVMTIYAWRGIGKSLFAMFLALCFGSGKWALNGRVCPSRKYRVLIVDGEMSAESLITRGERLCNGHGLPNEAVDELIIRSSVAQKEKIELETDAGFADLKPDMKAADIIIIDSIFKFLPSSMSPEFSATEKLQKLVGLARDNEKTLILIDHEGKGGTTSFGSAGKEFFIDTVLRLHRTKKNTIQATVQKVRSHAQPIEAYLEMRIMAVEEGEKIAFIDSAESSPDAALTVESTALVGEAEATELCADRASTLDEAIIKFITEQPYAAQKEVAEAVIGMGYGKRSTVQARIKVLSEAGKLPGWQNRTESHKVPEQQTPAGGQK